VLFQVILDADDGHPVNAWTTFIGPHLPQCGLQVLSLTYCLHQSIRASWAFGSIHRPGRFSLFPSRLSGFTRQRRREVDTLPWREATALRRIYLGGLKLRQVGDELGVCAGRVWHLRRKACAGMRAALAERGIDAGEFKKGSVPKSAAPGVQDYGLRRVRAGVLRD
jgi:hypothetical protein